MMHNVRKGIGTVLQAGPIPTHVAIIMDGNRRFADRDLSGDVSAGHTKGFSKVAERATLNSDTQALLTFSLVSHLYVEVAALEHQV